jgi:hypothetical protein
LITNLLQKFNNNNNNIARIEERRGVYKDFVGKPKGKNNLADLGVDGKKILRCICRQWDVGLWIGSSWLRIGTGDRLL